MTPALAGPYLFLIAAVAAERVAELILSRRNQRRLAARGGVEHGASHYPWMVALHTSFLAACVAEPWLLHRSYHPGPARAVGAVVALTMALRFWSMSALGVRWTTRIVVVPGDPVVGTGPYRLLRHPNYAAVLVELFVLPLAHGAWLTSLVFGSLNAVLLRTRVRCEEAALGPATEYPPIPGCSRSAG